jgi:hypothetical protein
MSLVKISGNASGTGTLTIAAPNTNTDYTLTLPTNTGTFLTSATTTGFPAGSVIQVVQAENATQTTVSSVSYGDSGLSGSITPTSSSSKILVIVNQILTVNRDSSDIGGNLQILRGASVIKDYLQFIRSRATGATAVSAWGSYSFVYLDSPATTSSTTYKTQISATTTANSGQIIAQPGSAVSMITLLEIAA